MHEPADQSSSAGLVVALMAIACLTAACSSGRGGDIRPEPGTTATTATGAGGSVACSTGVGGGAGGTSATGTGGAELNDTTAQLVMEYLPGRWDNAAQVASTPTMRAKEVSACALDAPELGERVLYLQRVDLATPDLPDVQIVLDVRPISRNYYEAVARAYVPDQPESWVSLCEDSTSPPRPPSEVRALGDECDRGVSYNDGAGNVTLSARGPAACVSGAPAATVLAFSSMVFDYWRLRSHDTFLDGDNALLQRDPPGEADYELDRTAEAR